MAFQRNVPFIYKPITVFFGGSEMKAKFWITVYASLSLTSPIFAVGQTSVITLEFPHGAENCGMGEVGVSLADNINSVFWNPAALPAIGEKLSVQYLYSTFYERLLPIFHLPQLWHTDTIHAVFLSNIYKYFDFGAAYSINFINMGVNEWTDELGRVLGEARSTEQVKSFSFGVRYAHLLSMGFAIKEFTSRMAPGIGPYSNSGIAEGQVFDLGFRVEKKFNIADVLDVHPALGLSIQTFPQDSSDYYMGDSIPSRDPLPLKRWYGGSIAFNLLDFFGLTYANEREYAVVDQEFISHSGYKIQLSPFFALLRGTLTDSGGQRFESHHGSVVTFNYQQILSTAARIASLFDIEIANKISEFGHRPEKYHLKPNIFFEWANDSIITTGARMGQKQKETTFGFSLIGDLGGIPSLKGIFKKSGAKKETQIPLNKKTEQPNGKDSTQVILPPKKSEDKHDSTRVLQDGDLVE